MSAYRGRIAPTPTGFLHLGHARTFWAAFLRCRQAGGALVLRNEDLDRDRVRPQYVAAMYEDLRWTGIRWDEGPDVGGPFAPYTQSQRQDCYLRAWKRLRERGAIYPCTCSRKDLAEAARAPHDDDATDEPVYPGTCRKQPPVATSRAGFNWRFHVPDGEAVRYHDARMGAQAYTAGKDFGDFLVWRKDDVPSYQLAVVVDDAAMEISEVVRGEDLLRSTARQLLLQRALSLPEPGYFHCPLVRDDQGNRLAKRHDALSLHTLREQGADIRQLLAPDSK